MSKSIQKIKSAISTGGGVARPHSYRVTITPPAGLGGGLPDVISTTCEQAELPGRQFATTQQSIYGATRKIPYGPLYNDLALTFICTEDMMVRKFFDNWHSMIQNPTTNYMLYYDTYISPLVTIEKINDKNEVTYIYYVEECYPVTIESQQLSYSETDSYLKLNVQMAYLKWRTNDDLINSQESSIKIKPIGTQLPNYSSPSTPGEKGSSEYKDILRRIKIIK